MLRRDYYNVEYCFLGSNAVSLVRLFRYLSETKLFFIIWVQVRPLKRGQQNSPKRL